MGVIRINSEECEDPGSKRGRGAKMREGMADTRSETGAAEWEKARHKVVRETTGSKGISEMR